MSYWEDDDELERPEPATIEVTVTDNPVVGVLLSPDGDVIFEVRERGSVPFGFTLPGSG